MADSRGRTLVLLLLATLVVIAALYRPLAAHAAVDSESARATAVKQSYYVGTMGGFAKYEKAVELKFINALYAKDRSFSPEAAQRMLEEWKAARRSDLGQNQDEKYLYEVLGSAGRVLINVIPESKWLPANWRDTVIEAAKETESWLMKDVKAGWEFDDRTAIAIDDARTAEGISGEIEKILDEAIRGAAESVHQRRAVNAVGSDIGVEFNASLDDLRRNPLIKADGTLDALLGASGRIEASQAELQAMAREKLDEILGQFPELRERLETLDAQQRELLKYAADDQRRREEAERVEREAREYQEKLQAAQGGVYLLSTVIGFADPKLGREVGVVGNAAIQVVDSLNKWSVAIAKLGSLGDKIFSMSTVIMTGNVVGAVMNVASLFAGGGKSPEDMVLEEIRALRQQVSELRVEMHDRFDRIDRTLNQTFSAVVQGFDRLGQDVASLQIGLAELRSGLNRFQAAVFSVMTDASRRDLWQPLDAALGYRNRTGLDMPYQPSFVDYESVFYNWGVQNAFDRLATGPDNSGLDDVSALDRLETYPLDTNINYLSQLATHLTGSPFVHGRAPNPRDWALASRAYAALEVDWSQHAARISPERAAALRRIGENLRADLGRMVSGGETNALFAALFAKYRRNLGELVTVLENEQTKYRTLRGFDPFGAADQHAEWDTEREPFPAFQAGRCGDGNFPLQRDLKPETVMALFPRPVPLAHRLRMLSRPDLDVCYVAGIDSSGCELIVCRARIGVALRSTLRGETLVERTIHADVHLCFRFPPFFPDCRRAEDEYRAVVEFRDLILDTLEDNPETHVGQARLETLLNEVGAKLRSEEQPASLGQAHQALQPGKPAELPARRVAAARAMIQAYVALGLPRALESDELLRSLLYGSQRIWDNENGQISALIARMIQNPPGHNFPVELMTAEEGSGSAVDRINALERVIRRYLEQAAAEAATAGMTSRAAAPAPDGSFEESHRLVETTLIRLEIADWFVRNSKVPPPPCESPDCPPPCKSPDCPPPCQSRDCVAPVVSRLRVTPAKFLAARRGPGTIAARRRPGTRVTYRLSEPARTAFTVKRRVVGRKVGGRCKPSTPRNRGRRHCISYIRVQGGFSHPGRGGANSVRFTGRLATRTLRPGRYRIVAVPRDAAGNVGKPRTVPFQIVR